MFGSIDKNQGLLFATYDLDQVLRTTTAEMLREVEQLDANRLLNTAPEDLKIYLTEKYSLTPVTLLREQWYVDYEEVQIDVSRDSTRRIIDRGRPFLIAGERFEVRIPFEGERELFYTRANTFTLNPPRAVVEANELVLRYDSPANQPRDVRPLVDQALTEIDQHLTWQRGMIDSHNGTLPANAEQAIQQRRARLLAQSQRAESLGIPIRRRNDAPTTYAVPTTRRKATPTLPLATTAQFKPEPVWAMDQYEQALKIMQDMALVMERSPEAFKSMDEEALRQHFLVQLNGQFEGRATGETFNMAGKTDILLREGDRNVFIAECKFWKGPKAFGQAIDQLLGYATWRDGKAAILVFNRGTDTSTVLAGIDATAKAHGNFKRVVEWPHESGFRYIVHSDGDSNREITLTVLVFHVPE
ncbi:hypothetical protein [Burkholderia stagnalis]|uniref:hypothetical protein n=1 Tax=Burkholderia stagnalis TaxID=1503054 RepID=UPI00075C2EB2|nr:hypothetical protein [Burkholderia stagnalis]KWI43559.1 hypothetical protein WT71_26340 [Burkholderia stagnalis]KWI64717.1 hypothetical protein WT73_22405 [Burkholderia stagnalis]KWK02443.1 hypothetical protein WT76_21870 [Burkholderia stagnalis]KWO22662.1 hypothetical protein WT94_19340 [Burkholderia stagnalis]